MQWKYWASYAPESSAQEKQHSTPAKNSTLDAKNVPSRNAVGWNDLVNQHGLTDSPAVLNRTIGKHSCRKESGNLYVLTLRSNTTKHVEAIGFFRYDKVKMEFVVVRLASCSLQAEQCFIEEAANHARNLGASSISFPQEPNLYWNESGIRAVQRRSQLGFSAHLRDTQILIKCLRPEEKRPCLFFVRDDKTNSAVATGSGLPVDMPFPIEHIAKTTEAAVVISAEHSVLDILRRAKDEECAKLIVKLFESLYPSASRNVKYMQARRKLLMGSDITEPTFTLPEIFSYFRWGKECLPRFLELVLKLLPPEAEKFSNDAHITEKAAKEKEERVHLAACLSEAQTFDYWRLVLPFVVEAACGTVAPLASAPRRSASAMLFGTFEYILHHHGRDSFLQFLNLLNTLVDLDAAAARIPRKSLHRMEIAKIEQTAKKPVRDELAELGCRAQLIGTDVFVIATGSEKHGTSLGDRMCDEYLDFPMLRELFQEVAGEDLLRDEFLQDPVSPTSDLSKDAIRFSKLFTNESDTQATIVATCLAAGISPDQFELQQGTSERPFAEIYDKCSNVQVTNIIAVRIYHIEPDEIPPLPKFLLSGSETDAELSADVSADAVEWGGIIEEIRTWFHEVWMDHKAGSEENSKVTNFISDKLGIIPPSLDTIKGHRVYHEIPLELVGRFYLQHGGIKELNAEQVQRWKAEFRSLDDTAHSKAQSIIKNYPISCSTDHLVEVLERSLQCDEITIHQVVLALHAEEYPGLVERAGGFFSKRQINTFLYSDVDWAGTVEQWLKPLSFDDAKRDRVLLHLRNILFDDPSSDPNSEKSTSYQIGFVWAFAARVLITLEVPRETLLSWAEELVMTNPEEVRDGFHWACRVDSDLVKSEKFGKVWLEALSRSDKDRDRAWYGGTGNFPEIPWQVEHSPKASTDICHWMINRIKKADPPAAEITAFALWWLTNDSAPEITPEAFHMFILAVRKGAPDQRRNVFEAFKASCETRAFPDWRTFTQLEEWLVELQPQLGSPAHQFFDQSFMTNHPWQKYGYSDQVCARLATMSAQPGFVAAHGRLLSSVLLTALDQERSTGVVQWTSQMILSQPRDATNLMTFARYYTSFGIKGRAQFVVRRINELLADLRATAFRDASGASLARLAQQRAAAFAQGKDTTGLDERRQYLFGQRERFSRIQLADGDDAAEDLLFEMNTRIWEKNPPKIIPEYETECLITREEKKFNSRMRLTGPESQHISAWMNTHKQFLLEAGIWERLIQFSSFAHPEGLTVLRALLDVLADPSQTRMTEVTVHGKRRTLVDIFGKFKTLEAQLTEAGVPAMKAQGIRERWQTPLCVISIGDTHSLVVQHDVERWLKHGEEPERSCQRVSSCAGMMRKENWNAKFGRFSNATGRPLGRILEGQFHLAELYEGNQLIQRNLIELAPGGRHAPQSACLLVEETYPRSAMKGDKYEEYREALGKYAAWIMNQENGDGHAENNLVIYADDKPTEYPQPFATKFLVYRDYFRTDREVSGSA